MICPKTVTGKKRVGLPRQRGRPCRKTHTSVPRQLSPPARLRVDDEELLGSRPRRRENQMTTVRSPRRIFVAPVVRQLFHALVSERDGAQLKSTIRLLRLIRDQSAIG